MSLRHSHLRCLKSLPAALLLSSAIATLSLPARAQTSLQALCDAQAQTGEVSEGGAPVAIASYKGTFWATTPDQQNIFTYSEIEDVTYIYDLSGNEKAQMKGRFWYDYDPEAPYLVTYVWLPDGKNRNYLYTQDGQEIATFENFSGFTPDYQRIVVSDDLEEITQILDLQGNPIATFPGTADSGLLYGEFFTPDGAGIMTYSPSTQEYSVFNLDGTKRFSFKGYFALTPDQQNLLVYNWENPTEGTRLLDFQGREKAIFQGNEFLGFTPDEQGVLIYSLADYRTRLYGLDGTEKAVFEGQFIQFTPDETGIITYSSVDGDYYLYDLDGTERVNIPASFYDFTPSQDALASVSYTEPVTTNIHTFDGRLLTSVPGYLQGFLPNNQGLITFDYETSTYTFYTYEGVELTSFVGEQFAFTPDGTKFIVYSWQEVGSRLFTINGEKIATFPGNFSYFTSDSQAVIIYSSAFDQTRLYTTSGTPIESVDNGSWVDFSPDEKGMIFYDYEEDITTFVPDFATSREIVVDGYYQGFFADNQGLITHTVADDRTHIYCIPPTE